MVSPKLNIGISSALCVFFPINSLICLDYLHTSKGRVMYPVTQRSPDGVIVKIKNVGKIKRRKKSCSTQTGTGKSLKEIGKRKTLN